MKGYICNTADILHVWNTTNLHLYVDKHILCTNHFQGLVHHYVATIIIKGLLLGGLSSSSLWFPTSWKIAIM